jgi:hypothetical protein
VSIFRCLCIAYLSASATSLPPPPSHGSVSCALPHLLRYRAPGGESRTKARYMSPAEYVSPEEHDPQSPSKGSVSIGSAPQHDPQSPSNPLRSPFGSRGVLSPQVSPAPTSPAAAASPPDEAAAGHRAYGHRAYGHRAYDEAAAASALGTRRSRSGGGLTPYGHLLRYLHSILLGTYLSWYLPHLVLTSLGTYLS